MSLTHPSKFCRCCALGISILLAASRGTCDDQPKPPAAIETIDNRLIAHWTFNESSNKKCEDASGHGWHATLVRGKIDPATRHLGIGVNPSLATTC